MSDQFLSISTSYLITHCLHSDCDCRVLAVYQFLINTTQCSGLCVQKFQVELGVVIGETASKVRKADAMKYVGGYTVALDMTARDFQVNFEWKFQQILGLRSSLVSFLTIT